MAWLYSTTQLTLADSYGNLLTTLVAVDPTNPQPVVTPNTAIHIEYTRTVNETTPLKITLLGFLPQTKLLPCAKIFVWRVFTDSSSGLSRRYLDTETCWLVQAWEYEVDNGVKKTHIEAVSANALLEWRVIGYTDGAPGERYINVAADNIIKSFISTNLVTIGAIGITVSTVDNGTNRAIPNFSVAPNLTQAPTITKLSAWRNLKQVCQEICQASGAATNPTPLFFDIVSPTMATLEARTYINQRGDDTGPTGGRPFEFGLKKGNITKGKLRKDYSKEVNFVYALGKMDGTLRQCVTSYDTARMQSSAYGRREKVINAKNMTDGPQMQAEADKERRMGMPRTTFEAHILSGQGSAYGYDWKWGNKVTGEFNGQRFPCRIDTVHVIVDQTGAEHVEAILRSDTYV